MLIDCPHWLRRALPLPLPRPLARYAPAALLVAICAAIATAAAPAFSAAPVTVGSKRFTESYILGEIVRQTLQAHGIAATHKQGLGNTGILEQALRSGAIDVYPEYTGTIAREMLKRQDNPTLDQLNALLAPRQLKVAVPLGFNNTYALALREDEAARRGITRLSDLADAAKTGGLRLGLSHEFLARADGWGALRQAYALPFAPPAGLDHGLAYEAIAASQTDVIDIYSTDAKIGRYRLRVLDDDRGFFPKYEAVLLMRASLDTGPLLGLVNRIDAARMIALNAAAELEGKPFALIAAQFIAGQAPRASGAQLAPAGAPQAGSPQAGSPQAGAALTPSAAPAHSGGWFERLIADDFWRLAREHVFLVAVSLALATALGVPLGLWAQRRPAAGHVILAAVGMLQTIPSLALLAFLIALMGAIGTAPAIAALFLYALLPVVRNTHAGLAGVAPGLVQAGTALGLTPRQCLRHIEVPLAAPVLLAGIQTAAVINVGTATMAAFVGAGGFGERITAGLALNDSALLVAGALPAAVLALLVQGGFGLLERRLWRMPPSVK